MSNKYEITVECATKRDRRRMAMALLRAGYAPYFQETITRYGLTLYPVGWTAQPEDITRIEKHGEYSDDKL